MKPAVFSPASASRWRCSSGRRTSACTPLMNARPAPSVYLSSRLTVAMAWRMDSGRGAFMAVSNGFATRPRLVSRHPPPVGVGGRGWRRARWGGGGRGYEWGGGRRHEWACPVRAGPVYDGARQAVAQYTDRFSLLSPPAPATPPPPTPPPRPPPPPDSPADPPGPAPSSDAAAAAECAARAQGTEESVAARLAQDAAPLGQSASMTALAPLTIPVFRMLWLTWVTANTCMWMNDVAAAWLMTTLTSSPILVALVQSASTLPVFLLGLPRGALADILDRRRYFIVTQFWVAAVALVLCLAILAGGMTAPLLLALT